MKDVDENWKKKKYTNRIAKLKVQANLNNNKK